MQFVLRIFLVTAFLAGASWPVAATPVSFYWDSNGVNGGAGTSPTGDWTNSFWTTSSVGTSATTPWNAGNIAVFSAGSDATSAYTVTISTAQIASGIIFEDGTATIAGTNILTLGSPATLDVASNLVAIVGVKLAGTSGFVKTNSGMLILTGTNTATGSIVIAGGSFVFDKPSNLPTGNSNVMVLSGGANVRQNIGGTFLGGRPLVVSTGGGSCEIPSGQTMSYSGSGNGGISGSGSLTKTGSGMLILSASNNFTGQLIVSEGVLKVSNTSGSATGSGAVSVNSGATFSGNGVVTGAVTVVGTISPDTATSSGTGTLTTGDETWSSGAYYKWEINDATGTMGSGWDLVNINGSLTISATSANPFRIDITSLTSIFSPGSAANFQSVNDYTWPIARTTAGVSGFDASFFNLSSGSFSNSIGDGQFAIELSNDGNDVNLRFVHSPKITTTPTSQTANANSTVIFNGAASGTGTLSYQWRKGGANLTNGGNITGATSTSLTLSQVFSADAESYTFVAINSYGSATSSNAVLTVIDPIISSSPQNVAIGAGSNAVFNVVAIGTANLNYQWRKNGSALTDGDGGVNGATTPSLTINGVSQSSAGSYNVIVSNSSGSATSAEAALTVYDPPQILNQPQSFSTNFGGSAMFQVSATGTALNYQWRKNGANLFNGPGIDGTTSDTLLLTDLKLNEAGNYTVVVSNLAGTITSGSGLLNVYGVELAGSLYLPGGESHGTGVSILGQTVFVSGVSGASSESLVARFNLPLPNTGGSPAWITNWPGLAGRDRFNAVAVNTDSFYVVGDSFGRTVDNFGGKEAKGMMVKFPLDGPTGSGFGGSIWDKQVPAAPGAFGYSGLESLNAVTLAKEGTATFLYTTGTGQNGPNNSGRLFLSKVKTDGTILWTTTDTPPGNTPTAYSAGKALAALNGNIYVAGRSDNTGNPKAMVQKYNSSGALLWTLAADAGQFNGVAAYGGAIYTVGETAIDSVDSDFLIQKRDESGLVLWSRTYDHSSNSQDTLSAVVGIGSRIYAVGSTRPRPATVNSIVDYSVIVLELDAATGDIISSTPFNGESDDIATGAATDGTDLYIIGESKSFSANTNLILLRFQIAQAPVSLTIGTTALPFAHSNVTYNAYLQAIGGKPPYTWTLSGSLPSGLVFSNKGSIFGTPTQTGQFNLVAAVTDSADEPATATQSLTLYSFPPNTPPTVTLTNPANGALFDAPATVILGATASDSDGIAHVDFYSGTSFLGSAAASPYTLTLANLSSGSYAFRAVAVDTLGASNFSAAVHITVSSPGTKVIDFEALNTFTGEVNGTILSNYLAGYGVTFSNATSGSRLAANNEANILNGTWIEAYSGDNVFSQFGVNGFATYTLRFDQNYSSVSFARTRLLADGHGVIGTAWRAYALDANGNELAFVGEEQRTSSTDIAAQIFTLYGSANIAAIRVESDNHSFAPLTSVVLDDLTLSTTSANSPPTVNITSPGGGAVYNAPAQVTVTAEASDADGSISQIAFYLGQTLIGSGASSPASVTVSNLAIGTYTFRAVAKDNGGATKISSAVTITVDPTPGTSVINFDALEASAGNIAGTSLSNYLAGFGVKVTNVTVGSRMEVIDAKNIFGGTAVTPTSPNNLFTQVGLNDAVSFTLLFSNPLQSMAFNRVAISAGQSVARWKMRAFNSAGQELATIDEARINSATNVPSRHFEVIAPNMASVRFDSDGGGSAKFAAVMLDDLILSTNSVTANLSVNLTSPTEGASFTAPAEITVSADATNTLGAVDRVEFYAGAKLIGVASSNPYSIVWSNVLAGTYSLKAKVFDAAGVGIVSSPITITVNAGVSGNATLLNFDALNASLGSVTGSAVSNYFADYGVIVTDITSNTFLTVQNQTNFGGGNFVGASSPQNFLVQSNFGKYSSFTLQFNNVLQQFQMVRPTLFALPNGVSLASWRATAYDSAGVQISQTGESPTSSNAEIPAQTFTLSGPGIARIRIESFATTFATFSAVPLDDFVLTTSATNIAPSVVITSPAEQDTFLAHANIPITATASDGDGSVTQVKFYYGGNLIGTDTSSPYSLTWSNVAVGHYGLRALATDNAGATKWSATVNIIVEPSAFVFGIRSQPASQSVASGSDVTFAVQTTGTNSVSYQWSFNGGVISGATSSALHLTAVDATQAGSYSVACTSESTTLVSDDAVLTILDAPVITAQPQGQAASIGDDVTFTVSASGSPTLFYQWRLNGKHIYGATDSSFTINAAQPGDAGNYSVLVRNSVGLAESEKANLAVVFGSGMPASADDFADRIPINPLAAPVIGNNEDATKESGEPDHAGRRGGKSIWYTWQATFTGVISLSTRGSSFDTLLAVYTGSDVAHLTPVAADDDSGDFGSSLVTFNAVAGTDYQIAVDGYKGVSGNVVLGLPAGGGYRVFDPTSGEAVPVITLQPENQIVNAGDTVSLNVVASSSSPLTYQWFFNGAAIQGATGASLAISNFQEESIGRYYSLIENDAGSVQSRAVVIQIGRKDFSSTTTIVSQDKFGEAVDLSDSGGSGGSEGFRSRPTKPRPQSGGDSQGYSVTQTFSTVGSTKEAGEPNHCDQAGGASEWYTYTTATNGLLHINTDGSSYHTILAIYIGPGDSFETLTNVGCNYYTASGQPHVYITNAPANTTYYIAVDGIDGATGTAHLNINLGNAIVITNGPQDRTVGGGNSATFTVSGTGSTNFYYRWRFNSSYISAATNSSYTVTSASDAKVGEYSVEVSNLVSVVTSAPPALLAVQYAPLITSQPTNKTVITGSNATFNVTAIGANSLVYRWKKNGTTISGATSTAFTISNCQVVNAGSYTVVITNSYGAVTSSIAILTVNDGTKPTVTMTSPVSNFRTNGSTITVRGTARDNTGLAQVQYKLGTNDYQTATGTTNWSAVIDMEPGTNTVTVKSIDTTGNESTELPRKFIYVITWPLTVITNGMGRITSTTGATNNAMLEIGRNYRAIASIGAGTNFVFTNWVTGTNLSSLTHATNGTTLTFRMQSNLIVQANFITNPFTPVSGSYNGLFYPTNGVTHQSSGFFSLRLISTSKGPFGGVLKLDGRTHAFASIFDLDGNARKTIYRTGRTPLIMELHLDLAHPDNQVTGSISNADWFSPVLADRATFNATNNPATDYNGRYTMIIPPTNNFPVEAPGGYGFATITNNINGLIILSGSLGDGSSISQAVPVSPEGHMPLYVSLYAGRGSLMGWMNFTNVPPKSFAANLSWIKVTNYTGNFYTNGFTNQIDVAASLFTPVSKGTRILNLSTGVLTLVDGNLPTSLTFNVSLSTNNVMTKLGATPTNLLSIALAPTIGTMNVTFRPTATGTNLNKLARGAVLQDGTNAFGWFLGTNQSGSFSLHP